MARKTIDNNVLKYFPTLAKRSTWGDAWDLCMSNGYEVSIYDSIVKDSSKIHGYKLLIVTLSQRVGDDDVIIHKFEFKDDERLCFYEDKVDIELEYIYKLCVEFLIKNKYIKKPHNSNKVVKRATPEHSTSEKGGLIKQRHKLTMKIYQWKKKNKDITELLKQKDDLNKLIKGS